MIDIVSKDIIDKYALVRTSAGRAEEVIDTVVQRYASDLDEFVTNAEDYLNKVRDSDTQEFDDGTLQRMVMRLPILLYRVCKGLDRAAIDSDVSKAAVESVRSTHYLAAPEGTIPERKAYADLKTFEESAIVDLTKHVHSRLKGKIEAANSLFDAIRKVMSARSDDKGVFGREQRR
jgi:hypothetical protein